MGRWYNRPSTCWKCYFELRNKGPHLWLLITIGHIITRYDHLTESAIWTYKINTSQALDYVKASSSIVRQPFLLLLFLCRNSWLYFTLRCWSVGMAVCNCQPVLACLTLGLGSRDRFTVRFWVSLCCVLPRPPNSTQPTGATLQQSLSLTPTN